MNASRWLSAPVRAIVWTLDVCDPKGAPSLAKMLALGVGAVAMRDAYRQGFTAANVAGMALSLSAAFGRSVFMRWLDRWQMTNHTQTTLSSSASVALTGDAAKVIDALPNLWRDDESGGAP